MGKTRLLARFADMARDQGTLVLSGRARGHDRAALAPLIDALDGHIADEIAYPEVPARPVRPPWSPRTVLPRPASPTARVRWHQSREAMLELLEGLAASGLVLIVDDVQWADEDTVTVLGQLLRRSTVGVILVVAYRRHRMTPGLRALITEAAQRRPDGQTELGPLSEPDAHALLGERGTNAWRHAVFEHSGGNPFYLQALAHSARWRGLADDPRLGSLPFTVEAALLAELDRLSPEAELAAHAAAILTGPFDSTLIADVSELSEPDAATAIEGMIEQDLIRPVATMARFFTFRHPVVRHVIHESSHPQWRCEAHARAARALARRGVPVSVQAHHVAVAARRGDLAAVTLLSDAAAEFRFKRPAHAARLLETALSLWPDEKVSLERTKLMLCRGVNLSSAGYLRQSRDLLHETLRLLPPDEVRLRAEAVASCALADRYLCLPTEGRALLLRELSGLHDQNGREAGDLSYQLACIAMADDDSSGCSLLAAQVIATAAMLEMPPLQCAGHGIAAVSEFRRGDVALAGKHLTEATQIMDGLLDSELVPWIEAAVWVGWSAIFLDRPKDALRHLDRALILARDREQCFVLPDLLVSRAVVLRVTGELEEAGHCAEEAAELAALTGCGDQHAAALAVRCWVLTAAGRLDEAVRSGNLAMGLRAGGHPDRGGWLAALPARALAEARLAAGDQDGCLALAAAVDAPPASGISAWQRVAWYEVLTRAALRAGLTGAASDWADLADAAARRGGLGGPNGLALLARAHVALEREPADALKLAAAARDGLSAVGWAIDALRARLVVGMALAQSGRLDEATAELAAVESTARALGALYLADQATIERRQLDGQWSRADGVDRRAVLASLTSRQEEIAWMVADGMTNRQIARRLRVTEKTVEMHLSHIFSKLQVSSRTAVASIVIRADKSGRTAPVSPGSPISIDVASEG